MKPLEVYHLLRDVQADYVAMVREMNVLKRRIHPVDPFKLPLVQRMEKAIYDLGIVADVVKPRQPVP